MCLYTYYQQVKIVKLQAVKASVVAKQLEVLAVDAYVDIMSRYLCAPKMVYLALHAFNPLTLRSLYCPYHLFCAVYNTGPSKAGIQTAH
jgi:hypothetical protein